MMKPNIVSFRALLRAACSLAAAALLPAQTTPPSHSASDTAPIELSPFEVTSTRDIGYQSTNAAEVTRMNTKIEDIPMNVAILNQEFIEDTLARSMEDVLEYVPGFVPTSNNDAWVVRGFANANTKFLNGFLQQESIGKVSVANIERVEVLKGPAAVLFGQGGYAATVNRVTKRPKWKQEGLLRASYGPLESHRFELDNTGPIGSATSPLAYRVSAVYDRGEYWREISHDETAVGGSLAWKISGRSKVAVEYLYVKEEDGGAVWRQPMYRGDPRGFLLDDGTYLDYGNNRQGYASDGDVRVWERGFAMIDFQHAFNRNLQLRLQLANDTKDQLYDETQPEQGSLTILKDAVLMPRRWRIRTQDVENWRSRNELVAMFDTGPASHRALLGFSWDSSDGEVWNRDGGYNRGGLAPTSPLLNSRWPANHVGSRYNVYPNLTLAEFLGDVRRAGFNPNMPLPVNVIDPGRSPAQVTKDNRPPVPLGNRFHDQTENTEFYVADVISFFNERFFLTGGLRHTRTDDIRDNLNTGVNVNDSNAKSTTFSTGLVYHFNPEKTWTLYANANSSFIPEFREQPDGTALDPEEGNQKEVGLRFSLNQNRIQGLVSVYEILQQNVAEQDENEFFIQRDGVRSRGAEFSLNARFSDSWSVMGGYAYNDTRDEESGERTSYAPYHMFTAFNKYSFRDGTLKGLDLSVGSIYIGDRPIDSSSANSLGGAVNTPLWTMPREWRFDVIARYRLPSSGRIRYDISAKVANVFDNQEIFKLADRVSMQRQPGRTLTFNLNARF